VCSSTAACLQELYNHPAVVTQKQVAWAGEDAANAVGRAGLEVQHLKETYPTTTSNTIAEADALALK
jgi:hypothetical protein